MDESQKQRLVGEGFEPFNHQGIQQCLNLLGLSTKNVSVIFQPEAMILSTYMTDIFEFNYIGMDYERFTPPLSNRLDMLIYMI